MPLRAYRRQPSLVVIALTALLAACGQQAPQPAAPLEDAPWSYTAPAGSVTALSLDPGPGDNTLTNEPLLSATSGWGPFELNRSNGEQAPGDGKALTLNGVLSPKGLGVHSSSELRYSLLNTKGATCSTFKASIGIDDEVGNRGSVIFQVLVDGVKKYDSGVMTGASATKQVSVNLTGGKTLSLVVTDAGDGKSYDHADWINPSVACTSSAKPAPGTMDTGFISEGPDRGIVQNALTPDGKILEVGVAGNFLFVQREDQDGHRDMAFNTFAEAGGTLIDLAVIPDGRFVLAATRSDGSTLLKRFLSDGTPDPTFVPPNPVPAFVHMAVQSDGRVLLGDTVAGTAGPGVPPEVPIIVGGFAVRRLLQNGSLDRSFGTVGVGKVDLSPTSIPRLTSLVVEPDDRVLAIGVDTYRAMRETEPVITRLTSDGSTDRSFSSDGVLGLGDAGQQLVRPVSVVVTSFGNLVTVREHGEKDPNPTGCQLALILDDGTVYRELSIPSLSGIGSHPLAIQVPDTTYLAGCDVDGKVRRYYGDLSQDLNFGGTAGVSVPDDRSVLVQPLKIGGKVLVGLNPTVRLWP